MSRSAVLDAFKDEDELLGHIIYSIGSHCERRFRFKFR